MKIPKFKVFQKPGFYDPKFEIFKSDFLGAVWSDADLVLANATCFDEDLVTQITQKCTELKKGAWIITTTKYLAKIPFSVNSEGVEMFQNIISIKR